MDRFRSEQAAFDKWRAEVESALIGPPAHKHGEAVCVTESKKLVGYAIAGLDEIMTACHDWQLVKEVYELRQEVARKGKELPSVSESDALAGYLPDEVVQKLKSEAWTVKSKAPAPGTYYIETDSKGLNRFRKDLARNIYALDNLFLITHYLSLMEEVTANDVRLDTIKIRPHTSSRVPNKNTLTALAYKSALIMKVLNLDDCCTDTSQPKNEPYKWLEYATPHIPELYKQLHLKRNSVAHQSGCSPTNDDAAFCKWVHDILPTLKKNVASAWSFQKHYFIQWLDSTTTDMYQKALDSDGRYRTRDPAPAASLPPPPARHKGKYADTFRTAMRDGSSSTGRGTPARGAATKGTLRGGSKAGKIGGTKKVSPPGVSLAGVVKPRTPPSRASARLFERMGTHFGSDRGSRPEPFARKDEHTKKRLSTAMSATTWRRDTLIEETEEDVGGGGGAA